MDLPELDLSQRVHMVYNKILTLCCRSLQSKLIKLSSSEQNVVLNILN